MSSPTSTPESTEGSTSDHPARSTDEPAGGLPGEPAGEPAGGPAGGRHGRRIPRRLVQLTAGLLLYGASSALLVRSGLGLEPWNVLHQGLARLTGLSIGVVVTLMGGVVLLLWIPLRQRPGLGTVANVLLIGAAMDGTLALLPDVHGTGARVALMVAGVVLNGAATGLYIAARFGPGPRDGLMTGLHRVTGRSLRLIRTLIEVGVVATGFLLGGSVGVGTLLYAFAIGPLAQLSLRLFTVPAGRAVPSTPSPAPGDPADPAETPADAPAPTGAAGATSGTPGDRPAVAAGPPDRVILPR
ncbi:membrane protein YczE [Streptomyces kanasensis]|uniref:membrane protein YczE n=1 Tax=Streptomyces kanasensis TaxID=936756 RepID=UPI0036F6358E